MFFGKVCALNGVSLKLRKGEIHSVIGPNGAGKTVMMNCISGLYRPQLGSIFFRNQNISALKTPFWIEAVIKAIENAGGANVSDAWNHRLAANLRQKFGRMGYPPYKRAKLGIARTFQKVEVFGGMSVLDNIRLGRHNHYKSGIVGGSVYLGQTSREEIEHRRFIEEDIVDLLEIEHIRHKPVGMLPYGLQKRVELGRALALEPELLILDEPLAGLNLEEVEDMARFILDVNEEKRWKVTCLLVEHDMGVVMDLSDRVFVLNFGNMIVDGTPEEVQNHPEVVKAYLGEEDLYATRR